MSERFPPSPRPIRERFPAVSLMMAHPDADAQHPGPRIRYALIEFPEYSLCHRSGHDCKRWYLRPTIDYLVD
jgi:hypothetical protein